MDDSLAASNEAVSRNELSAFLDDVIKAKMMAAPGDFPTIETSRGIIEHYNRHNIKAFEEAGYFIIQGVRVCEKGKTDSVLSKEARTIDEINFPGKK